MDTTSILVAVVMAAGSFAGSLYGIHKANSLVDYRLNDLTEEVRKHNGFASRIPILEEQMKVANHRIEDLERKVD